MVLFGQFFLNFSNNFAKARRDVFAKEGESVLDKEILEASARRWRTCASERSFFFLDVDCPNQFPFKSISVRSIQSMSLLPLLPWKKTYALYESKEKQLCCFLKQHSFLN